MPIVIFVHNTKSQSSLILIRPSLVLSCYTLHNILASDHVRLPMSDDINNLLD